VDREETMTASKELEKLGDAYWDWRMELDPVYATFLGDYRRNDRLADVGASGRKAEKARATSLKKELGRIDRAKLTESQQASADILEISLDEVLEEQKHRFWQWNVDQLMGPQVSFFEQVSFHPFRNDKDARDFVARCHALPTLLRDTIANLRAGLAEKRTAPAVAVERVIGQLKSIASTPAAKSPLMGACTRIDAMKSSKKASHKEELLRAIESSVKPAFAAFLDFLTSEYRGRASVGLGDLPGGLDAYQYRCWIRTTTDLSCRKIHEIGLEELASINEEMTAIARRLGHKGDIPSFIAKVSADPANQPRSREEVLASFRTVFERATKALPKWFGILPKRKCEIKPIESFREQDAPAAYYYPADEAGKRNGIYYANTHKPESRLKFNAAALTVHEAVPGHHLQVSIAQEQKSLPPYRRHGMFTAYIEGWALYTERLAGEMGLYENDLERFGMLTYQALRACRLVVDTGMHALGWSRDRAIKTMTANVAEGANEIANEIDRYIIWPGQALAYKVGQREISRLRASAEASLGPRFDIRSFHDVVLRNGAVPLSSLARIVGTWVESRRK
jgi:uncharacterized protein (DUF885 family)